MAWIVHLLQLLTISIGNFKLDSPVIVGGDQAKLGEIPYQVSLQDITSFHFCGGSVLNEKYVITAAHCVVNRSPSSLKVIAGSIDLNDPKETYEIDRIIVHEKFNSPSIGNNDIALVRIKNEFEKTDNLGFVSLPTKDFVVNANDIATVSGWGRLWEGGPTTNKLHRVNIVISDQNYCANKYRTIGYNVYPTQVCAYDPSTEKGSCHGDSGGPLTIRGNLVGLVSGAYGCASTSYPTVYTRVSSYIDWIKSNAV